MDDLVWHICHWLRYDPIGKCAAAALMALALFAIIWFFEFRKGNT